MCRRRVESTLAIARADADSHNKKKKSDTAHDNNKGGTTPFCNNGGLAQASCVPWSCVSCAEAPSNTLLLPCRHLCLCSTCSISAWVVAAYGHTTPRQLDCPVCAQPVQQSVHVFL